jgi:sulfatase maturation enzyme AslB (radical SAM superfamily)
MTIELTAKSPLGHPASVRHAMEDILAWPLTRFVLRKMTRMDNANTCFLERLCEDYNNPTLRATASLKWHLRESVIDFALKRAKLNKALMTEKLFHHQPTIRAISLAARSIAKYGLNAPQRFGAPLFVVWNLTQTCNLRCVHCYQNATAKPAPDELSVDEKLAVVDQYRRRSGLSPRRAKRHLAVRLLHPTARTRTIESARKSR